MLAVQQQKRLCRQFVDVSAARRGCHMRLWHHDELEAVDGLFKIICFHELTKLLSTIVMSDCRG